MISHLLGLLRVVAASFKMQAKERATNQFFIGTLLITPIIFTLLSVGSYIYAGKTNFGLYAVIGAGMIGIWNANLWTSGRIIEGERRGGTLSMLIAAPTPFPVVLVGKSLSNAAASLISMAMTFATGLIVFRLPVDIANPFAFIVSLLLTLAAMTSFGLVLGSFFVLTRNAGAFIEVTNYPIFILSGLMFPLTILPLWLRPLSATLAPMWGNLALGTAAGLVAGNPWLIDLYLIGLSLVYLMIARPLFAKIEHRVRQDGSLEVF
ncbi:MAG: ABC transporter permease [Chloroflexi bacterium]|nr:ABC transporter permease [Chloroflexota bacterium]